MDHTTQSLHFSLTSKNSARVWTPPKDMMGSRYLSSKLHRVSRPTVSRMFIFISFPPKSRMWCWGIWSDGPVPKSGQSRFTVRRINLIEYFINRSERDVVNLSAPARWIIEIAINNSAHYTTQILAATKSTQIVSKYVGCAESKQTATEALPCTILRTPHLFL